MQGSLVDQLKSEIEDYRRMLNDIQDNNYMKDNKTNEHMFMQLKTKSSENILFDKILKDKEEENLRLHMELDKMKK